MHFYHYLITMNVMFERQLHDSIKASLKSGKSILLIGPRQTGKSTLSREFDLTLAFNLSRQETFLQIARDPLFLEETLRAKAPRGGVVLIDEVQRVPSILNTVQYLIDEERKYKFILTGSSARKLRRGRVNLLPGRVHTYEMGPLTAAELDYKANVDFFLSFGSLPGVVTEKDPRNAKKLLKSYAITYLNEEIKAEALTKNFEGFTRFLFSIAADSSKYLDLTKISKAAQVPRQTTQRFFEILEDTLIVRRLSAFAKSEKRRLIQHPKFFIFDNGVLNALLGNFNVSEDRKGRLFENLFFNQLSTSLNATDRDFRLSSYRTDAGAEVDFILEIDDRIYAIEVKAGAFSKSDLGGFQSFCIFVDKPVEKVVVTPGGPHRRTADFETMAWQDFLARLKI